MKQESQESSINRLYENHKYTIRFIYYKMSKSNIDSFEHRLRVTFKVEDVFINRLSHYYYNTIIIFIKEILLSQVPNLIN